MSAALAEPTRTAPQNWPADRWPFADAPAADPDRALLHALRAGDEQAFAAFVRRHHESLVHVALGYVACRAVAEEVAQDAWLGFISGLDAFEGRCLLRTWLFRILVNRARSRGARDARVIPFAAIGPGGEGPDPEPAHFRDGAWATLSRPWRDPEARLMSLEAREALRAALAELPAGQRAVVALRDVEGLSVRETAELLELSEGNVRVLLHRGRVRLREALAAVVDVG
jgi:RNA polymerase sigma-70 factor (ECF subfamily)